MRRIVPSLTALQFFEAAVRHMSFTSAANELHVTQSAVSRQIRLLEDFLGQALFQRVKQRLVLTPAGDLYAKAVRDLIDRAEAATLQVMAYNGEAGILKIALLPTFGSRWLIPRLGDFSRQHPDIQLELSTEVRPFDFANHHADVAIHFGLPTWPGAVCHRLMGESMIPVCAPSLLADRPLPLQPADLQDFTLLQLTTRPQAWPEWLEAQQLSQQTGVRGPRFEQFHMVIQAAIAGFGMAVLPEFLIQEELSSGRLVKAFDQTVESRHAYYLVYPEARADIGKIKAFKDWLLACCAADHTA